jgi:multidrug efflux system membrane fusion protein
MTGSTGRRRRRIGRLMVAAVVVLAASATTVAGVFVLPGGERGGQARSDLPPATAQVTRQTLVDTQSEDGELGYGAGMLVTARLAGTVTALPAPGSTLKRGRALYRVDNTPVVLLYGSLPAYRVLSPGAKGADVKQLEQNLKALGYSGFTVDDEYSVRTADAVREWQDDLGLPESGVVELGRVVYATGPVRVDEQKAAVGDAAQPGTAVLTYTRSARVITVELDVSEARLARKGAAVVVSLSDDKTVPGTIVKTRTVIDTDTGSGDGDGANEPKRKIEVTVTVDDEKALARLDQATLKVAFTASSRKDVLTVPVAALLALAEGGYGVQMVDGTATRIVPVRTGLFAGGRVEVSGEGLSEGMTVGMPA